MKHPRAWFWRTWGIIILIFVGGSLPSDSINNLIRRQSWLDGIISDWLLHFGGFMLFALAIGFDYLAVGRKRVPYGGIVLRAAALGLALEIWQLALPSRSFQLQDLAYDLLGGLAGILFFWFLRRWRG